LAEMLFVFHMIRGNLTASHIVASECIVSQLLWPRGLM